MLHQLTTMQLSTVSSHPLDEILQEAPDYPFLFQLYVNKDRKAAEQVILNAVALGLKAIFLTVDAAGRGKRESDERLKVDEEIINPVTGERATNDKKGGGLTRRMGSYIDQSLNWEDIAWIRGLTNVPLILKGITTAADAKLAMKHRVDGIVLSNHGGRNLDYSPPSILLLLEMHKQCPAIFDQMEVFVDGGIRRGGDIIKALCLGATAVGMGRTFLYSLNYGTEGAEHLVESKQTFTWPNMRTVANFFISSQRRDGERDEAHWHPKPFRGASRFGQYIRCRSLGSCHHRTSLRKMAASPKVISRNAYREDLKQSLPQYSKLRYLFQTSFDV